MERILDSNNLTSSTSQANTSTSSSNTNSNTTSSLIADPNIKPKASSSTSSLKFRKKLSSFSESNSNDHSNNLLNINNIYSVENKTTTTYPNSYNNNDIQTRIKLTKKKQPATLLSFLNSPTNTNTSSTIYNNNNNNNNKNYYYVDHNKSNTSNLNNASSTASTKQASIFNNLNKNPTTPNSNTNRNTFYSQLPASLETYTTNLAKTNINNNNNKNFILQHLHLNNDSNVNATCKPLSLSTTPITSSSTNASSCISQTSLKQSQPQQLQTSKLSKPSTASNNNYNYNNNNNNRTSTSYTNSTLSTLLHYPTLASADNHFGNQNTDKIDILNLSSSNFIGNKSNNNNKCTLFSRSLSTNSTKNNNNHNNNSFNSNNLVTKMTLSDTMNNQTTTIPAQTTTTTTTATTNSANEQPQITNTRVVSIDPTPTIIQLPATPGLTPVQSHTALNELAVTNNSRIANETIAIAAIPTPNLTSASSSSASSSSSPPNFQTKQQENNGNVNTSINNNPVNSISSPTTPQMTHSQPPVNRFIIKKVPDSELSRSNSITNSNTSTPSIDTTNKLEKLAQAAMVITEGAAVIVNSELQQQQQSADKKPTECIVENVENERIINSKFRVKKVDSSQVLQGIKVDADASVTKADPNKLDENSNRKDTVDGVNQKAIDAEAQANLQQSQQFQQQQQLSAQLQQQPIQQQSIPNQSTNPVSNVQNQPTLAQNSQINLESSLKNEQIENENKDADILEDEKPVDESPNKRFLKYDTEIGHGSFKTVYKGLDTESGVPVAWCELHDKKFTKAERQRFIEEAEMLKQLQHPNIVRFYEYWEDTKSKPKKIILVTELMTSGTLKAYVQRFKKQDKSKRLKVIKNFASQILKGLAYLHSRQTPVIHRDLKCDNLFVTGQSGQVKIGDLGLATLKKSSFAKSVIGTPEFMAPEMYSEQYDESIDVYAFGMCLLEMATGEYPYQECTKPFEIYKRVTQGVKPENYYRVDNDDLRELIDLCIRSKRTQRPSVKELLNHSWFMENNGLKIEILRDKTSNQAIYKNDTQVKFRLKLIDKTKRKPTWPIWSDNEEIEIIFDIKTDDPELIVKELKEKTNKISDEDIRYLTQTIKDKCLVLKLEREDRLDEENQSLSNQSSSNLSSSNQSQQQVILNNECIGQVVHQSFQQQQQQQALGKQMQQPPAQQQLQQDIMQNQQFVSNMIQPSNENLNMAQMTVNESQKLANDQMQQNLMYQQQQQALQQMNAGNLNKPGMINQELMSIQNIQFNDSLINSDTGVDQFKGMKRQEATLKLTAIELEKTVDQNDLVNCVIETEDLERINFKFFLMIDQPQDIASRLIAVSKVLTIDHLFTLSELMQRLIFLINHDKQNQIVVKNKEISNLIILTIPLNDDKMMLSGVQNFQSSQMMHQQQTPQQQVQQQQQQISQANLIVGQQIQQYQQPQATINQGQHYVPSHVYTNGPSKPSQGGPSTSSMTSNQLINSVGGNMNKTQSSAQLNMSLNNINSGTHVLGQSLTSNQNQLNQHQQQQQQQQPKHSTVHPQQHSFTSLDILKTLQQKQQLFNAELNQIQNRIDLNTANLNHSQQNFSMQANQQQQLQLQQSNKIIRNKMETSNMSHQPQLSNQQTTNPQSQQLMNFVNKSQQPSNVNTEFINTSSNEYDVKQQTNQQLNNSSFQPIQNTNSSYFLNNNSNFISSKQSAQLNATSTIPQQIQNFNSNSMYNKVNLPVQQQQQQQHQVNTQMTGKLISPTNLINNKQNDSYMANNGQIQLSNNNQIASGQMQQMFQQQTQQQQQHQNLIPNDQTDFNIYNGMNNLASSSSSSIVGSNFNESSSVPYNTSNTLASNSAIELDLNSTNQIKPSTGNYLITGDNMVSQGHPPQQPMLTQLANQQQQQQQQSSQNSIHNKLNTQNLRKVSVMSEPYMNSSAISLNETTNIDADLSLNSDDSSKLLGNLIPNGSFQQQSENQLIKISDGGLSELRERIKNVLASDKVVNEVSNQAPIQETNQLNQSMVNSVQPGQSIAPVAAAQLNESMNNSINESMSLQKQSTHQTMHLPNQQQQSNMINMYPQQHHHHLNESGLNYSSSNPISRRNSVDLKDRHTNANAKIASATTATNNPNHPAQSATNIIEQINSTMGQNQSSANASLLQQQQSSQQLDQVDSAHNVNDSNSQQQYQLNEGILAHYMNSYNSMMNMNPAFYQTFMAQLLQNSQNVMQNSNHQSTMANLTQSQQNQQQTSQLQQSQQTSQSIPHQTQQMISQPQLQQQQQHHSQTHSHMSQPQQQQQQNILSDKINPFEIQFNARLSAVPPNLISNPTYFQKLEELFQKHRKEMEDLHKRQQNEFQEFFLDQFRPNSMN